MAPDALSAALRQCPFLARVEAAQGEAYALRLAQNPFASASAGPLLLEDGLSSFEATLKLFHGPSGVVPLRRFDCDASGTASGSTGGTSGCPFRAAAAARQAAAPAAEPSYHTSSSSSTSALPVAVQPSGRCTAAAAASAGAHPSCQRVPFASMSLSGFGFVVSLAWNC